MNELPSDPAMLLSFLNMKLRDSYASLEELCDDLDIDRDALIKRMADAGFEYSAENKRFW
ncbi:MAG: DUF4250 domain-containing protein [Bacteroides sp.]|nr:DUF4250 domain-containing protein [Bacteroides sp.]MDE6043483.1 DUF4250 domain-containing protein [Muribaculaceae bacterium]